MDLSFIWQSLAVISSTVLPYVWNANQNLQSYTLQACGALVILYIVSKRFLRPTNQNLFSLLFLNIITQTLIITTGKTDSPLFFIYYFVLFAFATYFSHLQIFTITLTTVICHLISSPDLLNKLDPSILSPLSLLLISPLAVVYNQQIIRNQQAKTKINNLEVDLSESDKDSLLWLSTESIPTINKSIEAITDLIIYLKSTRSAVNMPLAFIEKMKAIQSDLLTLYTSTDIFEESIKNKTDNNKE